MTHESPTQHRLSRFDTGQAECGWYEIFEADQLICCRAHDKFETEMPVFAWNVVDPWNT